MTTLRTLIDTFITGVCSLSIQELSGATAELRVVTKLPSPPAYGVMGNPPKPAKAAESGRLARRSPEMIAGDLARVVAAIGKGDGMNAETLRVSLNLSAKELPRILQEGLRTKVLKKTGQKRATVYTAGSKSGTAPVAKKAAPKAKKAAKKAPSKKQPAKKVAPKVKKAAPKAKKKAAKKVAPTPASKPSVAPSPSATAN